MDKQVNSATEYAKLIQITSCMLDALKKTAPEFSSRYRYLESAKFLLIMAFEPSSIKDMEDQENG